MRKNKNFQKLMIYAITAVMLLSAIGIVANAAFVEIGTGTSNSWYPTYGYYDYSYHGCIYLQSDIGATIDINKISYDIADYSGYTPYEYTIYNQQIYMTHTTLTTFPDSTPFNPATMTLVYDGDVHWNGLGWNDITLDSSFTYNGVDNLIVYWENHDGDYSTGDPDFRYTYISYRAKYGYRDGSFPTSGYRSGYCPNIRLHFPTDHDVAVTDIVIPDTIEGYGNIPVHVEVTNNGLNGETFPVNVKINSPPVTVLQEGFEGTYGGRPMPPLGWLVKDGNLDGYFSSVYAYNMWGSYYSSSYAHTGSLSMRCEDGYGGTYVADDWLFTPGVALSSGTNYNLDFWYATSSSSTTYKNRMSVYIGTAQNDLAMTTLLWQRIDFAQYYSNNYGFASVPVNVGTTGTYYIAWHVFSEDYDADIFLDDVHLYEAGVTIYDQTVIMSNLGVGATSQANLPDWVVASAGTYEIIADAQLGTDEYLPDNILTQFTTVGLFDGQLDSIDAPAALMGPDPFNPVATVSNQGAMYMSSMPVHATVLDPSGGTGTVFEETFEGAPSFSVFEGDVEVEVLTDDNVVAKHGDYERIDSTIIWPEDQPGFADPDDWTILNPDNNGAMWHLTDYRSSPASPTHSMYHGDENTKTYLPSSYDILISPKIHIGNAGGTFSFDIYNDVEGGFYDNVFFGVSPDGMSWGWWFGGSWWTTWYNSGGVPIFPWDVDGNGDGYVAFLFQSDSTVQYEGAYIDNVQVQGSPYLYDETVYVSLGPTATTQVTFPEFEGIPGYNDYTLSICCEEPKDSVPGNDCLSLMFNNNAPVWNARTGLGFLTIQGAIDDAGTIDGDTIIVNDGSFYEDIFITKGITVSALTAPDCDSGTTYLFGTVEIMADNVIFENFYVHPLTLFTADQAAITIYSSDVIVRHNTVEIQGDTGAGDIKGIWATAAPQYFQENVEISDNCVHDVINLAGATPPTLVTKLDEGFEGGSVPPSGWTTIVNNPYTWEIETYDPHTGTYYAHCVYDSSYSGVQSEWLISPSFDLSTATNTELSFWWYGSYYWSVSPYNNCDLNAYVSTGGGPWTWLWNEDGEGTFTNWVWYNEIISLAAYEGNSDVRIAFEYYGYDGAELAVDDILVTCDEGPPTPTGEGGAMGIKTQGAYWNVDVLRNEVYDVHSAVKSYGIEVQPYPGQEYTASFQDYLDFYEDFTGAPPGGLPAGWTTTHPSNWRVDNSNYAGGIAPELEFYWSPSATATFDVKTPEIDTAGFSTLTLDFQHYVSHYSGSYSRELIAIAGGTEYVIDTYPAASQPITYESYTLTAAHGVGASDFQIVWRFDGNSFNINWWNIDNINLYGSYSYTETVYPWPKDVNIEENHLYRISLGDGYPSGDDPINPGVMVGLTEIDDGTRVMIVTDASQVVAFHNWFDMDCFYPALAIINFDLANCFMATNNYYSAPDGPGSFGGDVFDCITGEIADGWGSQIVLLGDVAFDKWLGLNAVAKVMGLYDDVIYAEVGEPVLLDGSESWAKDFTGPFTPTQFFWDKGDGYLSFEETIAHIYTAPGTYHGFLRVHMLGIPEFGIPPMYEWDYFTVIVSSPGAPLTANGGGGSLGQYEVAIGEEVTLHGTASGGTAPYTFSWDLGDGRIVEGQNPTVIFGEEDRDPETATYTVTLTVIDANYDVATDEVTITVLAPEELNININAPINSIPGQNIIFHSDISGGKEPYSYMWNFDDGTTSTLPTPVHIFENNGVYTVTLTVTDGYENEETTTHTITVESETSTDAEIRSVKGGFGVKATIAAGDSDCTWSINVDGNLVLSGGAASGTIPANIETTVKLPLTLALGKVQITVTAGDITQQYSAFALGPIFLSMQEA